MLSTVRKPDLLRDMITLAIAETDVRVMASSGLDFHVFRGAAASGSRSKWVSQAPTMYAGLCRKSSEPALQDSW